jgi:DNA-binding protein HU-alpha
MPTQKKTPAKPRAAARKSAAKPAAKTTPKTAPGTAAKSAPKPAAATRTRKAEVAAASGAPTKPVVVTRSAPVVGKPELKKKELIDAVADRAKIKRKDAKPAVEAMLAILGETLIDGREMNLQPFGKLKINRVEEKSTGQVIICRVRRSNAAIAEDGAPIVHQSDKPDGDGDDDPGEDRSANAAVAAQGVTPLAEPAE